MFSKCMVLKILNFKIKKGWIRTNVGIIYYQQILYSGAFDHSATFF